MDPLSPARGAVAPRSLLVQALVPDQALMPCGMARSRPGRAPRHAQIAMISGGVSWTADFADARALALAMRQSCPPPKRGTQDIDKPIPQPPGDQSSWSDADRQAYYAACTAQMRGQTARDERRAMKEASIERRRQGFAWRGGFFAAGSRANRRSSPAVYCRPAFHAPGLLSQSHPILAHFLTQTPRAGWWSERTGRQILRSGQHKSEALPQRKKILGLDDPYVVTNTKMRGVLRLDLDANFPSAEALIDQIAAAGVPLPNLVVGHETASGLAKPHLIWLLANAVVWTEHGSARAKRLFQAVETRLTEDLKPLGADPRGLSNPLRVKNPLCPLWTSYIVTQVPYRLSPLPPNTPCRYGLPVLSDALALHYRPLPPGADWASIRHAVTGLLRHRQVVQDRGGQLSLALDGDGTGSNLFWSALRAASFGAIHAFHPDSARSSDRHPALPGFDGLALAADPARRETILRDAYTRQLRSDAESLAGSLGVDIGTAHAVAERQAEYAWRTYKPPPVKKIKNPGILRQACLGLTLPERQALGGRHSARARTEKGISTLARAWAALYGAPNSVLPSTRTAIVKALAAKTGYSERSVWRVGIEAIAAAGAAAIAATQPERAAPLRDRNTDTRSLGKKRPADPTRRRRRRSTAPRAVHPPLGTIGPAKPHRPNDHRPTTRAAEGVNVSIRPDAIDNKIDTRHEDHWYNYREKNSNNIYLECNNVDMTIALVNKHSNLMVVCPSRLADPATATCIPPRMNRNPAHGLNREKSGMPEPDQSDVPGMRPAKDHDAFACPKPHATD